MGPSSGFSYPETNNNGSHSIIDSNLVWTNEIIGKISKSASSQTGLAEGTIVTSGTIDAAAEAISVGVFSAGDMMMMYGSTMFYILVTDKILSDKRLWYSPWLFKGEHSSMGGLATVSGVTLYAATKFAVRGFSMACSKDGWFEL